MRILNNGGVISENTPLSEFSPHGLHTVVLRVLLTEVHYVDSPKNPYRKGQSPEVSYTGVVLGGISEGQTIYNIRDAVSNGSSATEYSERIYKVCQRPLAGKGSVPPNKQDGSIVYVAFLDGNKNFPLIIGKAKGALDRAYTGATKADGPRLRWQYNGVFFEINKNGELTLKNKGGTYKPIEGIFEPDEEGNKTVFSIKANSFSATTEGGVQLNFDGDAKKINLKAGSTELEIDSNTGKISLKGDSIDLGKSVVDMVTKFTELANAFANHTHTFPYSAGPTPSVGTTQPPTAPLASSVGSQSVKVQD